MARLDRSRPALVNKPIRLDPNAWEQLEEHSELLGITTAELIRQIVTDWLDAPYDDGVEGADDVVPMPDF